MKPTKPALLATAAFFSLLTLIPVTSHAAPDAARVAGDLRVDGIVFNQDGSNTQTKASPWRFSGSDIYYNGGNVGIGGTPNALYSLNVTGSINATNLTGNTTAIVGVSNSTVYPAIEAWNQGIGYVIRAWSGFSSPLLVFSVKNTGAAIFAGTVTAAGSVLSSDLRLKTDIQPLENTLAKLLRLRGVSYVMKADEAKERKIGVIAQEVEQEYPELVATDDKGMKSVAYANLAAVLIEAVKSVKAEKDSEIAALRVELDEIKQLLKASRQ